MLNAQSKMFPLMGPALLDFGNSSVWAQLGAFQLFLTAPLGYQYSNTQLLKFTVCVIRTLSLHTKEFSAAIPVLGARWGEKKKPLGSTSGIIINPPASAENEEDSAGTSWKLTPGLAPPLNQLRVLLKRFLWRSLATPQWGCSPQDVLLVMLSGSSAEQWRFGVQRWAGWRWQPWLVSPGTWNSCELFQHGPAAWLPAPGKTAGMLPVSHLRSSQPGEMRDAGLGTELLGLGGVRIY